MQDLRPLLYDRIQLGNHLKDPRFNKDEVSLLAVKCEELGIKLFAEFFETNVDKLRCPGRPDDAFPLDFGNQRNIVGDVKTYKSMERRGLFVDDPQIRVFKMAKELGYPKAYIVYINRTNGEAITADLQTIKKGLRGLLNGERGHFLKYDLWTKIGDVEL